MRLLVLSLISLLTATAFGQYSLTVENAAPVGDNTPGMVYRFYVNAADAADKLSAVYGDDSSPLVINTPAGIYNSAAAAGPSAEGLSDFLLGFFPEIADDSYATVNLTGAAASSGIAGAAAPQVIEDPALSNGIAAYFGGSNDGTLLEVNTLIGGSWFLTGAEGNASPDSDGRWLIAQVTTEGDISGSINVQIFPLGVQSEANVVRKSFDFDGIGEYVNEEILGCMDETACNYNPDVTDDDGSCVFADDACEECAVDGTVLLFDVDGDGVCDQDETVGCLNPLACNYNEYVSEDDGSCEYSCQGCLNPDACNYDETATIAGICDYASCVGCLDPEADNYDATATIEGACDYLGCISFTACNFDPNANVSDGSCEFLSCVGCPNSLACNYDSTATQPGPCIYPVPGLNCDGTCIDTDMDGVCDEDEVLGCTDETALNYDESATEDAGNCVLPVGGCTDPSACNYDASANTNDGSCDFESCFGCLYELACNYDENAIYPDASQCDFESCYGCTEAMACNYDDTATFDDGSCDFLSCAGCTDASLNAGGGFNACNYDPTATLDDGNCEYPADYPTNSFDCDGNCILDVDGDGVCDLIGCTDAEACNYNDAATDSDDSCVFADDACEVCEGGAVVLNDADGDGICDGYENCTSSLSFFSQLSSGQTDTGSETLLGPLDSVTFSLDFAGAGASYPSDMMVYIYAPNGDCVVWGGWNIAPTGGCQNIGTGANNSWPGNWNTTVHGFYTYTLNTNAYGLNGSGVWSVTIQNAWTGSSTATYDLDVIFHGLCGFDCNDPVACNYSPNAEIVDNESCLYAEDIYPSGLYDCQGECYQDLDGDGVCDSAEVLGCTHPNDCNYDPDATELDDSCVGSIGEGFCDCAGNVEDAIGQCGGTCDSDLNSNSICDTQEFLGCTNEDACNYNFVSVEDDGSCLFEVDECGVCGGSGIQEGTCDCEGNTPACGYDCEGNCLLGESADGSCSCFGQYSGYPLTVEAAEATDASHGMVYRFFVNANEPTDKFSAVFGNDQDTLSIVTPDGIYNDAFNSSWNASGINPALFAFFPDLQDDSYATIGLEGPASNVPGAEDPSLIQDSGMPITVSQYFQTGGLALEVNSLSGASWYVLNTAANALPDANGRWLIAQVTTTGNISGRLNYQIFPLGVGSDQVQVSVTFNGAGTFSEGGAIFPGCTDSSSCNYDPSATEDDGSCEGIPEEACDCDGNTLDAVGVCGGTCMMDANENGICDDIEVEGCTNPTSCNYNADANVDDGSCEGFPTGYCDCFSSVPDTDNDGVCDDDEIFGCDDPFACNYDSNVTENDGSCEYCSCSDSQYTLFVDTVEAYNSDLNVYRLYVNTLDAADALSAVYSNAQEPLILNVPEGIYNHPQGSWNAAGVNPGMFQDFPDLVDDSYVTIGLDGPAAPLDGNYQDASQLDLGNVLTPFFTDNGGTSLVSDTDPGISWYVLAGAENALPDANGQILIAQIATTGSISGTVNYQVFPEGNQDASSYVSVSFDGVGTFGQNYFCGCMETNACNFDPEANFDDGSCEYESCSGCMDMEACNFDATATLDDGTSCVYAVEGYDCDGNCLGADENMNMICDEEETGCMDPTACNYDALAYIDIGTCQYIPEGACDCEGTMPGYGRDCEGNCILDEDNDGLCDDFDPCVPNQESASDNSYRMTVEEFNVGSLGTTYRFYVNAEHPTDRFSAVYGNDELPLTISTPEGIYNDPLSSSWNASGIIDAFFEYFPDWEYDSYGTIGLEGPAANVDGAEDPSLVQDAGLTPTVSGYFQTGGTQLNVNTLTGASWYVLNTAANALPDEDGRWLIAQITTTGSISGTLNYQVFPLGNGADQIQKTVDFEGAGIFPAPSSCGCMDELACNYDSSADNEDGSCDYETCYGCMAVWSCNYDPNVIYDDGSCEHESCLGCTYEGACNYDGEATFDDGSCDFSCLLAGCTDPNAVNHYPAALTDDGSCLYLGCLDPEGLDYDPTATYPGGCDYPDPCPGDYTGDGVVDINDLLDFFQLWGDVCE